MNPRALKRDYRDLRYLNNIPKVVRWEVVAKAYNKDGTEKRLTFYESYDLIYDEHDLKIRKLDTIRNLEILRMEKEEDKNMLVRKL